MTREMKDVSVYFSGVLEVSDVLLITHKLLEEFPCRILPEFKPWYPSTSDTNKPIKPRKPPPLVSSEDLENITRYLEEPQNASNTKHKSKPEETWKRKSPSSPETSARDQCVSEPKKFKRSWCVITNRSTPLKITHSFSWLFRKTVEKHRLHLYQRVKWVVCEVNCVVHTMEAVWLDLNRAIRHSRLPTCNANFQRELAQIWVYCDVFYCEYIGNFLKQEFQLSGQISLTVHKLGDIIKL
ncbi:shieldin complex subunit 3-like [Myxocyprinus asiaticus]|uniref:shieldin complex subunit 3-like n=1 Tax=Myxocyprinus asiaticus TaxID=70543 RepID=UPI0022226113|nr:shieldin complex subunit 3-like [Myxocyprinus asiaticus]